MIQICEVDNTVPLDAFPVACGPDAVAVPVPVVKLPLAAIASTVPHPASYISGSARLVAEALARSKASLMSVALVGSYDGLEKLETSLHSWN